MRKKIQMKNWAAILMVCLMMMALCSCGKEKDSDLQKSVSETEAADAMESTESSEPLAGTETDATTVEEEAADSSNDSESINEDAIEPTPEPEEEIMEEKKSLEPEDIYVQVLDGYYADIVSEFPIDNYFPMTLGTFEAVVDSRSEEVLGEVGYTMKDINEDGTLELLIVKVSDPGETAHHGNRILALYTIVDDEVRFLTGGWARNRYFLLTDGRIYNEGSSGADDSSFETYSLIEDTAILEQIDSGNSASGDFEQRYKEREKLIETLEIKSFSEYEISEDYPESAKAFWSAVYVDPAENTFAMTGSDSYTADTSEYAMDLVFFTPSEVSEFKFNSLTPKNSDDGEVTFDEKELYSLDRLVMDKAVTITMEFAGDTPGYGISYTDAEGNVRKYAICESGFDGSIYLLRY